MKVCILSDSHDNRKLLEQSVKQAIDEGAEAVLHCGDVVAAGTLSVLYKYELPIHVIHGNNAGDSYTMHRVVEKSQGLITYHGQDAGIVLADKRIFIVHYPHYAEAMALTGDWDLICFGHDHEVAIRTVDNVKGKQTVLANPGTVAGIGANPTYIIADLESMNFEVREVNA